MSRKPLSKEDIASIMEALSEAYKDAGKQIKLAVLDQDNTTEILLDTRTPKDIQ